MTVTPSAENNNQIHTPFGYEKAYRFTNESNEAYLFISYYEDDALYPFLQERFHLKNAYLSCQQEINKSGERDGNFIEFYDNGTISSKGCYSNDSYVGTHAQFFENGQLRTKDFYENKEIKTREEYFENGKLKYELMVDGTKKHYYEDGILENITYPKDTKTGLTEVHRYHPNNQLKSKLYVNQDGENIGIFEEYFENGTLHKKGETKLYNGGHIEPIGPYEQYFDNGNLHYKCTYVELENLNIIKILQTDCEVYFPSGKLKIKSAKKDTKSGEFVGPYEEYFENGQLKEKCTHNSIGRKRYDMSFEYYFENGQLKFKHTSDNGLYEQYNEKGQLTGKWFMTDEGLMRTDKPYEEYFDNGQLKQKYSLERDNSTQGSYESYDEDGALQAKGMKNADGNFIGIVMRSSVNRMPNHITAAKTVRTYTYADDRGRESPLSEDLCQKMEASKDQDPIVGITGFLAIAQSNYPKAAPAVS